MKRFHYLILAILTLGLMEVKVTNIFGDRYSGAAGKAGVFATWKGRQYRRRYVIPANPNTTMQQGVRNSFKAAVIFWHALSSLERLAFSYLATGLVMSGFNYLVSRWQKAMALSNPAPIEPIEGIKQVGSDSSAEVDAGLQADYDFSLGAAPIKIGSLAYTPLTGDTLIMEAYVDLDMGDVRIPADIETTDGQGAGAEPLANDDQLVISYRSRGRTITREVLYTVTGGEALIPAAATIEAALRTAFWPIDFGTALKPVKVELYDKSLDSYEQIESLEILNVDAVSKIRFDLTKPVDATSHVDYTSYDPIDGAKLEIVKADTSFITWRKYATILGAISVAQTIEDAPYDWSLTAPGYVSELRSAQDSILAAGHELVVLTPSS